MKPLPDDPMAFQQRIMDALIGDILDTESTSFKRLNALREVSIQTTRDGSAPNKPLPSNQ